MDWTSTVDGVTLARAIIAIVAIVGSLLVIKFLAPIGDAVEQDEIGQTRHGEPD